MLSISDRAWVVLTKPDCPHCDRAKRALQSRGVHGVTYLDILEHPSLRVFLQSQGINTVPQVYAKGLHVGGADDLEEFLEDVLY